MALSVKITGARQNNLKNLSIEIPLQKIVCITGPSGSGKSSLAFDTLYAEGQRRYVESLNTYARQFFEKLPRPDIDSIENICPSIALEQKNYVKNSRSTVGTSTEIYDYLRLLFSKLADFVDPVTGKIIQIDTPQSAADEILEVSGQTKPRALIGFFLPEATPLNVLSQKGFLRLLSSKTSFEPVDPSSLKQVELKARSLIILDRLVIDPGERHRLTESLEASFREGEGDAFCAILDQQHFSTFSSKPKLTSEGDDIPPKNPLLFSFNSPLGACETCKGFGNTLIYDEDLIVPDGRLSIDEGALEPLSKPIMKAEKKKLMEGLKKYKIPTNRPYHLLSDEQRKIVFEGKDKFRGVVGAFKSKERKKYKLHVRVFLRRFQTSRPCHDCQGGRLKKEALCYRIRKKNIHDLSQLSLAELASWFESTKWTSFEFDVAGEILKQLKSRLGFLNRMGLTYLSLARLTKTLSGGETQRINLANQLGSELSGTLYVLDEPSIGLHAIDRDRLLDSLEELVSRGNSVVVVEHDLDTIRRADQVIELGPGSGRFGGQVVFQGDRIAFGKSKTLTAAYYRNEKSIPVPRRRPGAPEHWLSIQGAKENNLKAVSLNLPLKRLVAVSGVSGSGKSTLIRQTLFHALSRLFDQSTEPIGRFDRLFGSDQIRGVQLLDQTSIGKSSRSIPLSIIGGTDAVRHLLADSPLGQQRNFSPGFFSFNVPGGRCETCRGEGAIKTEMYFLDDLYLICEDCDGKRFRKEALDVTYLGKNIFDIFQMTVNEAKDHFKNSAPLWQKFEILQKVGLGYLQLGQPSSSLSGGEAQRLKIASEILSSSKKDILYILDEPTTGLHVSEIGSLIQLLQDLVDQGNTVCVIEHHLDVIKSADWVIDLGPGAGVDGGWIVGEGEPETIARQRTPTGQALKKIIFSR